MSLAPGSRVDRYELIAPLGAGGQGSVWKARDPLQPDVLRAVKLVELAGTKATQLERVRREARALAKLEHPSLVKCHAMFEDLSLGVLGLVLDYVDGPALGELLHDPRFTELRRATVLLHVAHALAYLHEQGVCHRDLKLENTLVRASFWDDPDQPSNTKIVDFGIAATLGTGTALTAVGHIVGTPAYMAPELLDPGHFGSQAPATAGDIFSFGVLAWKLLVGGHPTGLPPESSLIDYAVRYRAEMNRSPAWGTDPIPGPWGRLLLDCLEPDPYRRIADGAALQQRVGQAHRATRLQFEQQPTQESADAPTASLGRAVRPDLVTDYTDPSAAAPPARSPTEMSAPPSPLVFADPASLQPRSAQSRGVPGVVVLAGVFAILFVIGLVVAVGGTAVFAFLQNEEPTTTAAKGNAATPPQATVDLVPAEPQASPAPSRTPASPESEVHSESRLPGCDASAELCSCCSDKKACCASGSDCRGACKGVISADEEFHLRVIGASLKHGDNRPVDAFKTYPQAEVCVRRAGQGTYVCTHLALVRSFDSPQSHLPVTGRDLTATGLDIVVRNGTRILGTSGERKHSAGIRRVAICKGLDFNGKFNGDASVYGVSFFLDDPNAPAPRRCLAAD